MRWWLGTLIVGLMSLGMPRPLHAQATGMVLAPFGALEEPFASELVAALEDVVRERSYQVVPAGPGTVGPLDPMRGDDLQAFAGNSGVDRVVAVWVEQGPLGYDILVGVAARDTFGAVSTTRRVSPDALLHDAAAALRELMPENFGSLVGQWETPLARTGRAERSLAGRLLIAFGGPLLLAGWATNGFGSAFAGFVSTGWFNGTFDGAWNDFRVVGFIPVAGPWVQLAITPNPVDNGWMPWLVIDGLVQALGATLLIAGIAVQVEDAAVVPWVAPGHAGARLNGRF